MSLEGEESGRSEESPKEKFELNSVATGSTALLGMHNHEETRKEISPLISVERCLGNVISMQGRGGGFWV